MRQILTVGALAELLIHWTLPKKWNKRARCPHQILILDLMRGMDADRPEARCLHCRRRISTAETLGEFYEAIVSPGFYTKVTYYPGFEIDVKNYLRAFKLQQLKNGFNIKYPGQEDKE